MPTDVTDMLAVHRAFRREFRAIPALIAAVPEGDVDRATIVGNHMRFMVAALHHHHAAEDDLAWPKLRARAHDREIDIQRMVDEHVEIATVVDSVESLTAEWMTTAEPALTERLASASDELSTLVDRHLDDEELNAVPLIEKYMTRGEWAAAIKQAASFISLRNLRLGIVLGGMVLDGASDKERRIILRGAPLPQRLVVQLFGLRTLATYRCRLNGIAE